MKPDIGRGGMTILRSFGILIGFWDEEEIRQSGRKSVHPPVNL